MQYIQDEVAQLRDLSQAHDSNYNSLCSVYSEGVL
jgi:hypothetical protein